MIGSAELERELITFSSIISNIIKPKKPGEEKLKIKDFSLTKDEVKSFINLMENRIEIINNLIEKVGCFTKIDEFVKIESIKLSEIKEVLIKKIIRDLLIQREVIIKYLVVDFKNILAKKARLIYAEEELQPILEGLRLVWAKNDNNLKNIIRAFVDDYESLARDVNEIIKNKVSIEKAKLAEFGTGNDNVLDLNFDYSKLKVMADNIKLTKTIVAVPYDAKSQEIEKVYNYYFLVVLKRFIDASVKRAGDFYELVRKRNSLIKELNQLKFYETIKALQEANKNALDRLKQLKVKYEKY